jgi:WD40 repeat protein
MPQLLGRLMACGSSGVPEFLASARQRLPTPAIILRTGSLTPPGAETARLEGHASGVDALCQLADGRLASGSGDHTIRLWDVHTGAETARLEGHSQWVSALCQLADGRLASGSGDDTIRLWDVHTGACREITRLEVDAPVIDLSALLEGGGLAHV